MTSSYNQILRSAIAFASPIVSYVGFDQIATSAPTVKFMRSTQYVSLFLGLIVSMIIAGLAALCVVLIYALLTVGIETRQFDMGVMRMVGMTRRGLVSYVLIGAALFAIPAVVLGILSAQGLYLAVRALMISLIKVTVPTTLRASAVGWAILAGLGIPLASSIAPIMSVLSQSLPDALDTARSRTKVFDYSISRSIDRPISWTTLLFGIGLAVFCFCIFYLVPMSLFTMNLGLLFTIFFLLLGGILFGFLLLLVNFEAYFQTFTSRLLFFWEHSAVFALLRSNLKAHRMRNRKTSLMFSSSVAFVVFVTVAFDIELTSMKYSSEQTTGGALAFTGSGGLQNGILPYRTMVVVDRALLAYRDGVAGAQGLKWSYITTTLYYHTDIENVTLDSPGRYPSTRDGAVFGFSPDFLTVAAPRFLKIYKEDKLYPTTGANTGTAYPISEALYSSAGSNRYVTDRGLGSLFNVDEFNSPHDLIVTTVSYPNASAPGGSTKSRTLNLPLVYLDAAPVLPFTRFPASSADFSLGTPVGTSLPSLFLRAAGRIDSLAKWSCSAMTKGWRGPSRPM
jgi:hypothetical protein